ncbi:MAG TPA: threonylcarbamoyl-AMP synthase [Flavobacteriales bacterium]|nr:threonylcarbamoyl-AMP synthase [Flavobacteriales bacterium]HRE75088.1 L-threonylcarbamoyladenylate synthase [Flavobacteriales bacterium]HRJ35772.1 L-threonylcarbamoyladenylate synthase [Flavobacteriales bacterium]HRJ39217.1 L-threonylcarbamoyladenylate synthase [Flavobacteriales bacterium]
MKEYLEKALEVLKNGGIILYPTDTIWGIGCDAGNPEAVKRIYDLKKRDDSKSMIVLVENTNRITRHVREVPEVAWDLIELSDKPLTVVFDRAYNLAPNLIGEDGSIGIRVCMDEFCNQLIKKLNRPIVSTSANISGQASPRFYNDISNEIRVGVDHIVNLRRNETTISQPSSIIRLKNDGQITILRK